ncbi:MAG: acyl-CoA dehydratase activase [Desulfobacterales bacterium]|jgi:predicted CoA-substrate-specific enzyme activase
MYSPTNILGIDVGSVSVSVALVNSRQEVLQTEYGFHQGNIVTCLKEILHKFNVKTICGIASTASSPSTVKCTRQYDNQICVIEACRFYHDAFGAILVVGGEKFGLIQFDDEGNYHSYRANSSCAAGTGSFLDQQAQRLNLKSIEELSEIALENTGAIPKIASRCAVFAKTDLVHAQQEGYSLVEICDGLCYGLAKNIADTLFGGQHCNDPVIFTGGVSHNKAVVKHLMSITGKSIFAENTCDYGAIGAALNLIADLKTNSERPTSISSVLDIVVPQTHDHGYAFDPIELEYSDYPDFNSLEKYQFSKDEANSYNPVEVDIYNELPAGRSVEVTLGFDIGSTSTKAVLYHPAVEILAGFYTRTAGRPIVAVQHILAAIADIIGKRKIGLTIQGVATTGSGRKLIGKIIGADLIIDEITAHARAAVELDPNVDTIIEIGGQDSKFTTLQNGRVTFCAMNNVCAAGTGSFIEEQAQRLGCALSEYSSRTENRKSPMASDRCTVFMERDVNHYLNEGYDIDEVLAAVLHSIRENYLTKVAVETSIGNTILFQGATAKIKSLVAAFEQRLRKPVRVSKYCHLTGAFGAALSLIDEPVTRTQFKGIRLYQQHIPVRSEVCNLCTNHCKISISSVDRETVAYGFLCGRDYDTLKYVNNNLSGFDLLKARKKAVAFKPKPYSRDNLTIGIPAALQLLEDLPFWKKFFSCLSIKTVTSEGYADGVNIGKYIAGAEFCAPLTALYGHVKYLQEQLTGTDPAVNRSYIFLPAYLEQKTKQKGLRRQYCYYTQYAATLASSIADPDRRCEILRPLANYLYSRFHTKAELYRMLKSIIRERIRFKEVSDAYDEATAFKQSYLKALKTLYRDNTRDSDGIHVVFLGRPYTILDKCMNKGIPDLFASMGIKTFFQDMLSFEQRDVTSIEPLLNELHWHYAMNILAAAEVAAKTQGAYPVLVTSFKCSPDSFVIDYFKKVMEFHFKPYLILQLDEHSSSVGYETRIEAAIRSFKNHSAADAKQPVASNLPIIKPVLKNQRLLNKTLVFPNWDNLSLRLVIANLKRIGIDARLLQENETSIQRSLRYNSGQCLPLNIIAQDFIDYVNTHGLDPANTVLWMAGSSIACNIKLYPHHIKSTFDAYGNGMEKAGIYVGELSLSDISLKLPIHTYFAYMFGGFIRKIGCRLRPYEKTAGITDSVVEENMSILEDAFLVNRSKTTALEDVMANFERIEIADELNAFKRPKVAIFGDLYVRDNHVINQDLIHFIEANGGEVVTTPYSSYMKMIAKPYLRKWFIEGRYLSVLSSKALLAELTRREKRYYRLFNRILNEPQARYDESPEKILADYNLRIEHTGESMDNILKVFYVKKFYPDVSLFVQTSPAFCCPSLVTEAMAAKIEAKTGIPIISITYDGTGGNKNRAIIPYLKYPRCGTLESNRSASC